MTTLTLAEAISHLSRPDAPERVRVDVLFRQGITRCQFCEAETMSQLTFDAAAMPCCSLCAWAFEEQAGPRLDGLRPTSRVLSVLREGVA